MTWCRLLGGYLAPVDPPPVLPGIVPVVAVCPITFWPARSRAMRPAGVAALGAPGGVLPKGCVGEAVLAPTAPPPADPAAGAADGIWAEAAPTQSEPTKTSRILIIAFLPRHPVERAC